MRKLVDYDLTQDPIGPIIRSIAIPASIGTLFNTLYNIVDTYWAGRLSTDSLAALSLNFPVYLVAMSIGVGISSGTGALISNFVGSRDEHSAKKVLLQSLLFAVCIQLVLIGPMLLGLPALFELMGSGEGVYLRALSYARVIITGSIFMTLTMILNSSLTSRGNSKIYRNVLFLGFFFNLGLDPLLMNGVRVGSVTLIPALEEAGIALATILIQLLSALYIASKARSAGVFSELSLADLKPDLWLIRQIVSQSSPAFLSFLIMASGTFVITYFISAYGSSVVAAYGSAVRIEQVALIPTMGLTTALSALVGQNNGAGRFDRIRTSRKTSLLYGAFIMVVLLLPVLTLGKRLLGLFTDDTQVIETGYQYLLIQGITFYSYIILFQSNSVLQGLKRPTGVMWISLYRQILAPAVIFTLLSRGLGMEEVGIWWGIMIVNWSAALMTLYWSDHILSVKEHKEVPET